MAITEIIMPKMGESIMEATVLNWLKQPGDYVEADEFIVEVATDKIDTEVPSPIAGYLKKVLVPVGSIAEIGKPICIIDAVITQDSSSSVINNESNSIIEDLTLSNLTDLSLGNFNSNSGQSNPWISPLIKQICQQEKVSQRELSEIVGSGLDNRVTKKDVLNYIAIRNSKRVIASGTLSQGTGLRLPGCPRECSIRKGFLPMSHLF
jgi:2-oxoglutarate dehydrogenase E2 component (dihydrolipoamide succinyltransferase)